jgi:multidrug efflux pump subunit AcrA (membrane-fusion protein)
LTSRELLSKAYQKVAEGFFVKGKALIRWQVRSERGAVPGVQHGPSGTPQASFVYVVESGKAVMRPVTVGVVQGDRASIDKGLNVGETVVTDSTDRLRDGSQIEIRTPGGASGANGAAPGGGARTGRGKGTRGHPGQ